MFGCAGMGGVDPFMEDMLAQQCFVRSCNIYTNSHTNHAHMHTYAQLLCGDKVLPLKANKGASRTSAKEILVNLIDRNSGNNSLYQYYILSLFKCDFPNRKESLLRFSIIYIYE